MLLALLATAALSTAAPEDVTVFDEIVVEASPFDRLVRAAVSGDLGRDTLVVSDPAGMECGAFEHRYVTATRRCWVRARPGAKVTLTARHPGRFGADWTVDWTGCQAGGAICELEIPERGDVDVSAAFRRL